MFTRAAQRALLMLLLVGPRACFGADTPAPHEFPNETRLATMRAAATDAANRSVAISEKPSSVLIATAVRAAIPLGTISISSVTPSPSGSIGRFGQLELTVNFSAITALTTSFFEPDPLRGGVDLTATFTPPSGAPVTTPGFWDGTSWRVRFSPTSVGTWSYIVSAIDSSGTATTASATFTCSASSALGFVHLDGARFVDANGLVFHGIGHNNGWLPVVEQPAFSGSTPAIAAYGTVPAIASLDSEHSMQATGENLLSFWLCSPWEKPSGGYAQRAPIENIDQGIGIYNQDACTYLDGVVQRAEAAGIRLLPSIWAHDQLRAAGHPWGPASWLNNAYSAICSPTEFMTTSTSGGSDTEQWRRQKSFYRYINARWGSYPAIIGWVGVVEMEGTNAFVASQSTAGAWCGSVRQWFSDHDFYRSHAGTYPITFSRSDQVVFNPGDALDVLATDSYSAKTNDVSIAATLGDNVTTLRNLGKPCFHSEWGGQVTGTPHATQPLHYHHGLWADFAAGSSLSALLWCDGQGFPRMVENTTGQLLQNHLSAHARIVAQVSFLGDLSLVRSKQNSSSTTAWIQANTKRGFAWIMSNTTPQVPLTGQNIAISGINPGSYDVQWFDTWGDGLAVQSVEQVAVTGSTLTITVPVGATPRTDQFMTFAPHVTIPPPVEPPVAPPVVPPVTTPIDSGTESGDTSTNSGGCGLGSGVGAWLALTFVAVGCHLRRRKTLICL